MAAFTYKAMDSKGKIVKGIIEADSPRLVRQQLREKGLTPTDISLVGGRGTKEKKVSLTTRLFKRVQSSDLTLLTQQLATLLEAGLPVEETLQAVIEQSEKSQVKEVMSGVRARVLEGHSLADAMAQFPHVFPELYCATIAAGEQTGNLHIVLIRLADYAEKQQIMRQKISQALVYPALMTLVSIGIVSFLLVFVVPKIIGVFSSTGQALPGTTVFLVDVSHFLASFGLYIVIAFIIGLFIFFRLLKGEAFRTRWHKLLLKLPLLGYAIQTINTARYSRTFGILFAAGVSVIEAMRVSARLITSLPMRKAINAASQQVKEGTNIHQALKQTGYFTPMSIHLIASGESSGQLGKMLEKTADNQERDVSRLIETLLSLFEPMIILVMGGIVLFIVLAILLPIFQLDQMTG